MYSDFLWRPCLDWTTRWIGRSQGGEASHIVAQRGWPGSAPFRATAGKLAALLLFLVAGAAIAYCLSFRLTPRRSIRGHCPVAA